MASTKNQLCYIIVLSGRVNTFIIQGSEVQFHLERG